MVAESTHIVAETTQSQDGEQCQQQYVSNMQAITNMYGPSHKAFLIVPLCGAFFVDLINATVIQVILKFFV